MKRFKKIMLIILGSFFVLLGIIGIILPVMPTTPFLIVAGLCYINSSKKLYGRLIKLKYFGPVIESYVERREVTKKFKIYSMLLMYIPTAVTELLIVKAWYLRVIPIVIVGGLTWHILTLKTVNKKAIEQNTNGLVEDDF